MSAPPLTGRMVSLCSWHPRNFGCELVMGAVPCTADRDGWATHGICAACRDLALADLRGEKIEVEDAP